MTRKYLHKIEMELVNLCEDNEVMREAIISKFTDLMQEVGGFKWDKMKTCPKCKDEIDHLDFDVSGSCMAQIYQEDVIKNNKTDYDIDCLTDGVKYNNFSCPECHETLFDTEEEATEFLKGRVEGEQR